MSARSGTGDDDSDRSASASQTNADGSSRDGLDSSLYGTAIGEEPASGPALESSLTATTELGSVDGTRKMRKTDIVTNENNVDSLGRAMTFLEKELELLRVMDAQARDGGSIDKEFTNLKDTIGLQPAELLNYINTNWIDLLRWIKDNDLWRPEYNGSEEGGTGVLRHVGVNNVYYQDGVTTRKVLDDRHWPLLQTS